MILVTGVTGGLGNATINALLKIIPASEISGMVRDLENTGDLLGKGISIKQGNYLDYDSMVNAFQGVDKLILISAPTFTDRITQHRNVINAAIEAGIKHIIYTGIQRKKDSSWIVPMVTESDKDVEKQLKESGLIYTIIRNNVYADVFPFLIENPATLSQVLFPAGDGKISFVVREEFGEALANLVVQEGHENKTYTLSNAEALSLTEIAEILSGLSGKLVKYVDISRKDYVDLKVEAGIPRPAAQFAADWADAVREGELAETNPALENLLGRKPTSLRDYLNVTFFATVVSE